MRPALGVGLLAALAVFVLAGGATARGEQRPLLRIAVVGGGSVRTSDARVRCSDSCSAAYRRGRLLTLSALPGDDFLFDHWEGACFGKAPACDVALDRTTSVRAVFVGVPYPLEVVVGGPGRITSSVGGIDCGDSTFVCRTNLPFGSDVTLTPVPSVDARFGGWDGRCAPAGTAPCTLQIGRGLTDVAAAFGHSAPQPGPQTLTVHSYGGVTSDPPGIDCPAATTCSATFPSGTLVLLRIVTFGEWQPPCRGDLRRCALIVDEPTDVVVAPEPPTGPPPPPPPPAGTLLVTVSGGGLVTSSNGAIRCGWAPAPQTRCADSVPPSGATRSLRAKARRNVRFARWGGRCRGAKPRCTARLKQRSYGRAATFSVTGLFRRR